VLIITDQPVLATQAAASAKLNVLLIIAG